MNPNFRKDINGLRAWAIVSVVLFHFRVPGFGGGFVGVDIFFVLSGFLMTGIILNRPPGKPFSLADFYWSRFVRIVPALAVLCGVLIVAGWFVLSPRDYQTLSRDILASILFHSNLSFARDTNYFAAVSQERIMLHTWSLSVEWQFYIVYPVVLQIGRKMAGTRGAVAGMVLLASVSLLRCFVLQSSQASNFFLLPSRAWEMVAGGTVALIASGRAPAGPAGRMLELAGIAALSASIFLLDETGRWPGGFTLLPVAGTMAVLLAARDDSVFTSPEILQKIGTVSYSVYLYHWPLAVFLLYFGHPAFGPASVPAIALCLVLGAVSWRYVERGATRLAGGFRSVRLPLAGAAASVGLIVVSAMSIDRNGGVVARLNRDMRELTGLMEMPGRHNGGCFYDVESEGNPIGEAGVECVLAPKTGTDGIVFGDSFAGQYDLVWKRIAQDNGLGLRSITSPLCFPTVRDEFPGWSRKTKSYLQCRFNRRYFHQIVKRYDFVVLGANWANVDSAARLDGAMQEIEAVAAMVPLVIVMPSPTRYKTQIGFAFLRKTMLGVRFDPKDYETDDLPNRIAQRKIRDSTAHLKNVVLLPPQALFDGRAPDGTHAEDGLPLVMDSEHLNLNGSNVALRTFLHSGEYRDLLRSFDGVRKKGRSGPDPDQ